MSFAIFLQKTDNVSPGSPEEVPSTITTGDMDSGLQYKDPGPGTSTTGDVDLSISTCTDSNQRPIQQVNPPRDMVS